MHLDTQIGEFGEFAQKTRVTLGDHLAPLVPEVEHVAQKIYRRGLVLDAVEEGHQAALPIQTVGEGQRAEMGVAEEVGLHER